MSIVALGVSTASAVFTFANLREARKPNAKALVDFMREYRDYEPDRRVVINELSEHSPDLGTSELPDDIREKVNHVCHYLDHLGFLIAKRAVKPDDVAGLMGHSILVTWKALSPYIIVERRKGTATTRRTWSISPKPCTPLPSMQSTVLHHMSPTAKLPAPVVADPSGTHNRGTTA